MSQYKQSMERMNRPLKGAIDDGENDMQDDGESHRALHVLSPSDTSTAQTAETETGNTYNGRSSGDNNGHNHPVQITNSAVAYLQRHADFLLMPILPLLWCLLLISTLSREDLLSAWGMPLLGIGSATLANAVPVGGGIVFVPVLHLLGYHITLGSAFAVSTMAFGNGVFGFLSWLKKDPSAIVLYVLPAAVIPAWIGSAIGTLRPLMTAEQCKTIFALFAIKVAAVVWRGLYVGRRNMRLGKPFSIGFGSNDAEAAELARQKKSTRYVASACSFFSGLILVSHIGIGNALISFLVFTFVWKLPPNQAVVSAIVAGGWTSLCPFLIHLLILKDVPLNLWICVLPGVWMGAKIAPRVHVAIGIVNVLALFTIFLLLVAILMVSA